MLPVGYPRGGRFCISPERQVHQLCIQCGDRQQVSRRCVHNTMESSAPLHVSSSSSDSEGVGETLPVKSERHFHSPLLASSGVVSHVSGHVHRVQEATYVNRPPNSGCGCHLSSRRGDSTADFVEDLPQVKEVLDRAKKPSTTLLYRLSLIHI